MYMRSEILRNSILLVLNLLFKQSKFMIVKGKEQHWLFKKNNKIGYGASFKRIPLAYPYVHDKLALCVHIPRIQGHYYNIQMVLRFNGYCTINT